MKKIFSVAIALLMMLSASAMPILKRDVKPMKMAGQEVQATVTGGTAQYVNAKGWWRIFLDDGTNSVAGITIAANSKSSIAGVYPASTSSLYYVAADDYAKDGYAVIEYLYSSKDATTGITQYIYSVKAVNWVMEKSSQVVNFEGTVSIIAVDDQYYKGDQTTDWEHALIVMNEKPFEEITATEDVTVIDSTKNGWFSVEGYSNNYGLILMAEAYDMNSTYEVYIDGTAGSFIADFRSGTQVNINLVQGGGLVRTQGATITFDYYVMAKSGVTYHIVMVKGADTSKYLQYDSSDATLIRNYSAEPEFDAQYISDRQIYMMVGDATSELYIMFVTDHTDPVITVPEGKYEINFSEANGTVYPSTGYDAQYGAIPSCAYTYDKEGYTCLWFFQAGTIEVKNAGGKFSAKIDATNSYGRRVSAVVGNFPTAVDEAMMKGETTKMIENGQLIIIRNGMKYNVQGAVVE